MSDPLQELIDEIHTEIERQLAHIKRIDPKGDAEKTQGCGLRFHAHLSNDSREVCWKKCDKETPPAPVRAAGVLRIRLDRHRAVAVYAGGFVGHHPDACVADRAVDRGDFDDARRRVFREGAHEFSDVGGRASGEGDQW